MANPNFYPRSPCGERPCPAGHYTHPAGISIHALLAESDVVSCGWCGVTMLFLSTLSLRRATRQRSSRTGRHFRYFYPRSPCGERPASVHTRLVSMSFLSTLSLRRATTGDAVLDLAFTQFLSTLSLRRATPSGGRTFEINLISIHALLAESDCGPWSILPIGTVFLSTLSLRRATLKNAITAVPQQEFLSTLSLRRATLDSNSRRDRQRISIHALLAESDMRSIPTTSKQLHFYPRSPCGERPDVVSVQYRGQNFYPRSPCGERPDTGDLRLGWNPYFYPRSPCGERLPQKSYPLPS